MEFVKPAPCQDATASSTTLDLDTKETVLSLLSQISAHKWRSQVVAIGVAISS